jgi:FlaA1/EpsC-like NDP-sugar epimerase
VNVIKHLISILIWIVILVNFFVYDLYAESIRYMGEPYAWLLSFKAFVYIAFFAIFLYLCKFNRVRWKLAFIATYPLLVIVY